MLIVTLKSLGIINLKCYKRKAVRLCKKKTEMRQLKIKAYISARNFQRQNHSSQSKGIVTTDISAPLKPVLLCFCFCRSLSLRLSKDSISASNYLFI